jgi:hypothetical protein
MRASHPPGHLLCSSTDLFPIKVHYLCTFLKDLAIESTTNRAPDYPVPDGVQKFNAMRHDSLKRLFQRIQQAMAGIGSLIQFSYYSFR